MFSSSLMPFLASFDFLLPYLPDFHAFLNFAVLCTASAGWYFIRRGRRTAHQWCMMSSVLLSGVLLFSLVTYHHFMGYAQFPGRGWVRPVYFFLLISHILLAALLIPLVLDTLGRALLRGNRDGFASHRRIARWTLPTWIYVSSTGVIIYWMVFHLYPALD